jgi:hypothetical protein
VPESYYEDLSFNNKMNREKLRNEFENLQHLGSYPSIIKYIKVSKEGIEILLFKRGSLRSYI